MAWTRKGETEELKINMQAIRDAIPKSKGRGRKELEQLYLKYQEELRELGS